MYDQSFNAITLLKCLRKSDFFDNRQLHVVEFKEATVAAAIVSVENDFNGINPLESFHFKKKALYRIPNLSDELVVRKICANLKSVLRPRKQDRNTIVANVSALLAEGLPYRLYRLDIKGFYESISHDVLLKNLALLSTLSPMSKAALRVLLAQFAAMGGQGVPRGLALSALLADMVLRAFDAAVKEVPGVYFVGRYVDDIIILTNAEEGQRRFLRDIRKLLPSGLTLNESKTRVVTVINEVTAPAAGSAATIVCDFEYLGYQFTVSDPLKPKKQVHFRQVEINIAASKVKKIKNRIVRSFLDFGRTADFALLLDRLRYLTSNFSLRDRATAKHKLAGIYHSYPHVNSTSARSLKELDHFLKNAIMSKKGRVFSTTSTILSSDQRRKMMSLSFSHGHSTRVFIHFPPPRIRDIQECWTNE